MAVSGDQPERQRWRWPQFTIRGLLAVTAILAAFWGFLQSAGVERDDLPVFIGASFVCLWGLLCWRTVRLNTHFFQSRKRWTVDSAGRPQIPPSRFRDAWFFVAPALILAFYAHFFIFVTIRGAGFFSTAIPAGCPGHLTWAEGLWFFAESLALGVLWYATGGWVCVMVARHPSIQFKLLWQASALVLSPIVCPFLYFTILRPSNDKAREDIEELTKRCQNQASDVAKSRENDVMED